MIKRVSRDEAQVMALPGRDWHTYIGPQNTPTERVSLGVSVFPAGSHPEGHVHDTQEETIYCAAGRGRIVTPDATARDRGRGDRLGLPGNAPRHRIGRP